MNNKVAIVTGASRGIGAATAKLLGKEGYLVCVNYYKNVEKAEAVVADIKKSGGNGIVVQADISKEEEIVDMFKHVVNTFGPVTALVNNAGISGDTSFVEDVTLILLESVFMTNVYGPFLCAREAIKHMKQAGHGCIVNVSSEAAEFGGHRLSHYAASKAAINAFTVGFAREAAQYNVRVNAVSPGIIDTDANKSVSQERAKHLKKSLPMGRMGTPVEVAETILWLLSDKASYITGSIVSVAGGR